MADEAALPSNSASPPLPAAANPPVVDSSLASTLTGSHGLADEGDAGLSAELIRGEQEEEEEEDAAVDAGFGVEEETFAAGIELGEEMLYEEPGGNATVDEEERDSPLDEPTAFSSGYPLEPTYNNSLYRRDLYGGNPGTAFLQHPDSKTRAVRLAIVEQAIEAAVIEHAPPQEVHEYISAALTFPGNGEELNWTPREQDEMRIREEGQLARVQLKKARRATVAAKLSGSKDPTSRAHAAAKHPRRLPYPDDLDSRPISSDVVSHPDFDAASIFEHALDYAGELDELKTYIEAAEARIQTGHEPELVKLPPTLFGACVKPDEIEFWDRNAQHPTEPADKGSTSRAVHGLEAAARKLGGAMRSTVSPLLSSRTPSSVPISDPFTSPAGHRSQLRRREPASSVQDAARSRAGQ